MPVQIAVVYYSATGNVHKLAEAIAEGAGDTGAEVRLPWPSTGIRSPEGSRTARIETVVTAWVLAFPWEGRRAQATCATR